MTNHEIVFKPLREEDLTLLFQWFQKEHVLRWYARGQGYTLEMIKEKYRPRLDDPDLKSYIIHIHDKPVGYIQLYRLSSYFPEGISDYSHPLFSLFQPHELAGIDLFMADENYLGKGYASKALMCFVQACVKNEFRALLADPSKENSRAIAFFMRNGFREVESPYPHDHAIMLLKW
ncbi:Bifunctional AAC/APH [Aquicella siphonis]|uniref:Bifunctional AAC/APH n=1 Tax=Aquicella siphonis TaxID=254247 RepID=A0A5E4PJJ6_9COXI|nr:GNAT family N-acetyltransferase [Aquicella siphonis]VVC77259.1 Bifunctional AAC/APH [Aquicella siphonis]